MRPHHARPRLETLDDRSVPALLTTFATSHVDIDVRFEDGALEVGYHNEDTDEEFAAADARFFVGPDAITTQTTNPSFGFIGAGAGNPVFFLPAVETEGEPLIGIAAEDIAPGTFASYFESDPRVNAFGEFYSLQLLNVRGPGEVAFYEVDPLGNPVVWFATSDGIDANDTFYGLIGSHNDQNITFTKAGRYELQVRANVFQGPGQTNPLTSEVVTLVFDVNPQQFIVVGTDAGGGPQVQAIDPKTGQVVYNFFAFDPSFTGGVRVAAGDVTGDGVQDIIAVMGPGGLPLVRVFDGATGALAGQFLALIPQFTGGLYVAAGDVNGDGFDDLIVGAGPGAGPVASVFSGADFSLLTSFFAYNPAVTSGVTVAAGDVNGDGFADVITGTAFGFAPHVQAFDVSTGAAAGLFSFFAYNEAFTGGVFVSAADVNGDGLADIITGTGAGFPAHVVATSGADGSVLASFFAYNELFTGGVRVAAVDVDDDLVAEILTGVGPGGGPQTNVVTAVPFSLDDSFFAFIPEFLGGVYVGGTV